MSRSRLPEGTLICELTWTLWFEVRPGRADLRKEAADSTRAARGIRLLRLRFRLEGGTLGRQWTRLGPLQVLPGRQDLLG